MGGRLWYSPSPDEAPRPGCEMGRPPSRGCLRVGAQGRADPFRTDHAGRSTPRIAAASRILEFWKQLQSEGWIYLHDQFGKGPHAPELLPVDIRGMADDPFRSLAWELRQVKGYTKVDRPFCEFSWANFL